jgi:hypothetical protein
MSPPSASPLPSPDAIATTYPSGSMATSVGHARTPYCCQVSSSGSSSAGCAIRWHATARSTAAWSDSCGNFGECTPTTTSRSPKRSSSRRNSSMTRRQLMQQNVQKSSTTTRPRTSRSDREMSVLIHPPEPRSSGARTRPVAVVMARTSSRVRDRSRDSDSSGVAGRGAIAAWYNPARVVGAPSEQRLVTRQSA